MLIYISVDVVLGNILSLIGDRTIWDVEPTKQIFGLMSDKGVSENAGSHISGHFWHIGISPLATGWDTANPRRSHLGGSHNHWHTCPYCKQWTR